MRNYGGDFNTIANNKGIPIKEAKTIYDNYMKGFPGIKKYQDYCRAEVIKKGYILLNPIIGTKAFIWDFDKLKIAESKFTNDFWDEYYSYRGTRTEILSKEKANTIWNQFTEPNTSIRDIAFNNNITTYTAMRSVVRHYSKRKSDSAKQSINYRIQGTGAVIFKVFSMKFFNWLHKHNLLFTVKYCVPVHDEANIECPKELTEQIDKVLGDCMEDTGKIFCKEVDMPSDSEIGAYWIH